MLISELSADLQCPQPLKASFLTPDCQLPLLLEWDTAVVQNIDFQCLLNWLTEHQTWLEERLLTYGGILFRGFPVATAEDFELFVKTLKLTCAPYTQGLSPRNRVHNLVYTSTEYPAYKPITLHNELTYSSHPPKKKIFFCEMPPEEGGETPIVDSRVIYQKMKPSIRNRFIEKQVCYFKRMPDGEKRTFDILGKSWQQQFETSDRQEVETYLIKENIDYAWQEDGSLTTRQFQPGVTEHPVTHEPIWSNQVNQFHYSTYGETGELLRKMVGEEALPINAFYGDGTAISPETIQTIRELLLDKATLFHWQKGDVLMLDNLLVAHGRMPYVGDRRILTAMGN